MYLWYLTIYVVFGVFLVVLSLALYERLKAGSPAVAQTATAFGIIWAGLVIASGMVANVGTGVVVDLYSRDPAQAASLWLAVNSVVRGLGGGNEIVGGLWVLLVSWAALRAGELPRLLNYLGLVLGRGRGHPPYGCPGSRDARGRFWPWSHRVVRMAGDWYVAQ